MGKTSRALVSVPPRVELAITPKPTRTEIVSALTKLRIEAIETEQATKIEERARLVAEVTPEILELSKAGIPEVTSYGNPKRNYDNGKRIELREMEDVSVAIRIPRLPKQLSDKLRRLYDLPSYARAPDEKQVRREITSRLNGSAILEDRVEALLSSPAVKAKLTKMLKAMEGK